MVLGRGPEEDEDPLLWALKKTGAYPFQSIVGVRDIVGSLESGFDYQLSPVTDVVNMAIRATRKAGEGDLTERSFIKPAFLATGAWYGLPARQLWMTTEYIYDYLDGEVDDFSFYEALVTGDNNK